MTRTIGILACGISMMLTATPGGAEEALEAAALREELQLLRAEYEARIADLESRLSAMESKAAEQAAIQPTAKDDELDAAIDRARVYADEFRPSTESIDIAARFADAAFRERIEDVLSNYVDITGYFRAGYGRNEDGGPQVGFKAPGAAAKYRLGNEAETYGEITLGKSFYTDGAFDLDLDSSPPGPIAHWQARLAFVNPYSESLNASTTDISLPETWASIGNVIPSQPHMKFWAGNRFYRRHDIHLNDFFFYNMSGGGGGFEDMDVGVGKLSLAWIGWGSQSLVSSAPEPDPENQAGFSKQNWDLRLHDVNMPFGFGEFGLTYATMKSGLDAEGNQAEDSSGFAFNFIHTSPGFISEDGVNKFSVQYGRGPAITFTSGFDQITANGLTFIRPDEDDFWRLRITENFTANLTEWFSLGPVFVYEVTDYGRFDARVYWVSAGVRPIFHFNNYLSLALEGGVDRVDDELFDAEGSLYKLTVAPQVSLGNRFMSRPVLRAFVTWATWSDEFIGQVGGPDFTTTDSGVTAGVQMEAWW